MKINYTITAFNSFFLIVLVSSILGLFSWSCKKYAAATPAFYLKANSVSVVTTSSVQGSNSSNISELWLYLNGKYQGAYAVGNLMPIPNNNKNIKVDILAGIKNNGIKGTRIPFNFYETFTFDTIIETSKVVELPIKFKYNPNVKFAWVEGFDGGAGFSIVQSGVSSASFTTINSGDNFEGNSLKMQLTTNQTIAQIETAISYTLPTGSSNVYLELDYKCFKEFEIGLIAGTTEKPVFVINPSSAWKKTYINLAEMINSAPTSNSHKIYFKMKKSIDSEDARLFLDNIKLIHF